MSRNSAPHYPEDHVHWVSAVSRQPTDGKISVIQMPVASRKPETAKRYFHRFFQDGVDYDVSSITLQELRGVEKRFAVDGPGAKTLPSSPVDRLFGHKELWLIVYFADGAHQTPSEVVWATSGKAVVDYVEASHRIAPMMISQTDFDALIERLEAVRDRTCRKDDRYAFEGNEEINEMIREGLARNRLPTSGPRFELLQEARERKVISERADGTRPNE